MKILIVDDNQTITDMLSKYLTVKGFEITIANDGRDGLSLIQKNKFDAILLDMSMPDFSGIDIIATLEKDGQLKDKKIVLFTASSVSDETINELLKKEGIETCLRKPVEVGELVQAIST